MEPHEFDDVIRRLIDVSERQVLIADQLTRAVSQIVTGLERIDGRLVEMHATLKNLLPQRRTNGHQEH
jgi:hypothetical protein